MVEAQRLLTPDALFHVDTPGAQRGEPAPTNEGKGVFNRGDDTADARGNDPFRARARPALVRAGLEGAVQRGPASPLAGFVECVDLRVGVARAFVRAVAHHDALVGDDTRPHHRVR